jgi:hypothetical protein
MTFNHTNTTDCCLLFPPLMDDLQMPIHTAPRDVKNHFEISRSVTNIIDERWKENHVVNCEKRSLPFYDFPKWPFIRKQLDNTSNLLFWDGSIQVPRCFITEMLPWLSILLQHSHLIGELGGYSHNKGRTRRSSRYIKYFC